MPKKILQIKDLKAYFHTRRGIVKAVDGVSFDIHEGETLGIVGESGSGKSVCQLSYMRLLPEPPLKIESGQAIFNEQVDLLKLSQEEMCRYRGNEISMVFQEPMTSLNPYMRIGEQVIEPLLIHRGLEKAAAFKQGIAALERVGIPSAEQAMRAYPHEFSGGMRQRVMIAMALTTKPKLLVADEPTTALDVTVQAQILDLLKDLQEETGMAILFISHDLGVIAGIADRIVVMYAGHVMEQGSAQSVFHKMRHPYTQALLRSTPRIDLEQGQLPTIGGTPPNLSQMGPGCPFVDRCGYTVPACSTQYPKEQNSEGAHIAYCHHESLPEQEPA